MQPKGKEETDRFMRAIAAFSAAPDEITRHGRRLQQSEKGLLQAILVEIDETVLRRHLVFATEVETKLVLDVGERRVLAAVSMPTNMDAEHAKLAGRPLNDSDAAAVYSMLNEFSASKTDIFVFSHLSEESEVGTYGGLSAKTLLAQEKTAELDGVPDVLIRAIGASKARCHAIVVVRSGETLLRNGDPDLCENLLQHLSTVGSKRPARRDISLWRSDPNSTNAVVLVQADDILVVLVGLCDQLQPLFATWRDAVVG